MARETMKHNTHVTRNAAAIPITGVRMSIEIAPRQAQSKVTTVTVRFIRIPLIV
jgi:hypothetical protein